MHRSLGVIGGVTLVTAAQIVDAQEIHVGPNVHVSAESPRGTFFETWSGADPRDANRLIGCSSVLLDGERDRRTFVYLSTDRGRSWARVFDVGGPGDDSADPVCAFGVGGPAL